MPREKSEKRVAIRLLVNLNPGNAAPGFGGAVMAGSVIEVDHASAEGLIKQRNAEPAPAGAKVLRPKGETATTDPVPERAVEREG